MAPRLIARSFVPPVKVGSAAPQGDEIVCDLGENTEPVRTFDPDFLPLFKC